MVQEKLAGILGRVGDAVKVKGLFVRGAQVEAVAKRFPEVLRVQAVVTRTGHQDHLEVVAEVKDPATAGDLAARLGEALREEIKVRPEVRVAGPGAPLWIDMTPTERIASGINTTHLVWDGPAVTANE